MIQLLFYVEGQTEQGYVNKVLSPHLTRLGVQVLGPVLAASGKRHGRTHRGGGKSYGAMRKELGNLLKQHNRPNVRFTTMFDLYALYAGFPGRDEAEKIRHLPYDRVRALEAAFAADVNDPRFLPHLQLHEFETILLCDLDSFALEFTDAERGIAALKAAVVEAGSPELVNDGVQTAPSWRIRAHFPDYKGLKKTTGVELAECVGLETTRRLCPHFDAWLRTLEALASPPA